MCQDQCVKVSDAFVLSTQAPMLPQLELLPAGGAEQGFGGAGPRSASAGSPAAHWPMPGRVEFMGVVLRYVGQSAPALDGLDLDVPGGSKIGVCGRTGKFPVLHSRNRLLRAYWVVRRHWWLQSRM